MPLAAVIFGASVIELIPRMIVGGLLVFLGLAFMVEWVWDKRRSLPPFEYGVVLVILAVIIAPGVPAGRRGGLVLAVVLFAVSYGRIELVREVAFGDDLPLQRRPPPPSGRACADGRSRADPAGQRVLFFGSTNRLLERSARVEAGPPRFLVIDLQRATGVDSSGVVAFAKVLRLAEAHGFEVVLTGASETVRAQLARGGVVDPGARPVRAGPGPGSGALRGRPAAEPAPPGGGPPATGCRHAGGRAAFLERVESPRARC